VGARGADEAIVSDDLVGQQNPSASQGPLDWNVLTIGPELHARKGHRGTVEGARLRIRPEAGVDVGLSLKRTVFGLKVAAAEGQFEAVLGKTRRTEF